MSVTIEKHLIFHSILTDNRWTLRHQPYLIHEIITPIWLETLDNAIKEIAGGCKNSGAVS